MKSYVWTHNNTYKLKDVFELLKRGAEHVTPEMWKHFVEHVKKVEEEFWDIEHVTDSVMDEQSEEGERHVLMIKTGDTSSSDSDSD